MPDWSDVKSVAKPSVRTLSTIGVGAVAAVSNLIQFEIFRDFWQIVSLFFTGLSQALPGYIDRFFGNFSVVFSFCYSCWFNDPSIKSKFSIAIFVIECIVALLAFVWFLTLSKDPDEQNQGLEATKWESRGSGMKKKIKWILIVMTTLYLPVFRDMVSVCVCDVKYFPKGDECAETGRIVLVILGVIALLGFIIPAPIVLFRVIQRNKPKPSYFDAEGRERVGGYTLNDYRTDLAEDSGPYKKLYEGYERDWAYYKVLVMILKICLVLPTVLFVNTNQIGARDANAVNKKLLLVQSGSAGAVLLIYCGLSTYSAPFIKNSDDYSDMISRWTALAVAIFGLLASQLAGHTPTLIFGILLNVTTAIGGIICAMFFISGNDKVRTVLKSMGQRIAFTESRETGDPIVFSDDIDFVRERKLRIWHEFWDTLFRQDSTFRIPPSDGCKNPDSEDPEENDYTPKDLAFQYGGTPPYLLSFDKTVGERHAENKEIIEHEGFQSYEQFISACVNGDTPDNARLLASMRHIMTELVGVDAYWDGPTQKLKAGDEESDLVTDEDEGITTGTKFGKLYVIPVPFCAILACENKPEVAIFTASPVVAGRKRDANEGIQRILFLASQNQSPEIQRRRHVRSQLRALAGAVIHWPIEKYKHKTISRTVSYQEDGQTKTRTESKTVEVLFHFENGNFNVSRNGTPAIWNNEQEGYELNVTKGLTPTIAYNDGTGEHYDEAWGKNYSWTNEPISVGGEDFGLNDNYDPTERFQYFMGGNYTATSEQIRLQILAQMQSYRNFYRNEYAEKERILSYAFWYYIYNNAQLDRNAVEQIFAMESNEQLKTLSVEHSAAIAMVYDKLDYFNESRAHAYWFVFWHDLWIKNCALKVFQENEAFLSPFEGESICYQYKAETEKQEIIDALTEKALCGKKGVLRSGFINEDILSQFFDKLGAYGSEEANAVVVDCERQCQTKLLRFNGNSDLPSEYSSAVVAIQNLVGEKQ